MNESQMNEVVSAAVARACFDYVFRRELLRDPKAALRSAGVEVAEDIRLEVHEIDPKVRYIFLPMPANAAEREQAEAGQPWAVGPHGERAPRAGRHFGFVANS
jgi:hypothetical protein